MSLPEVIEVRNRIDHIPDKMTKFALMTAYLYAGRISEVVGKVCFSEVETNPARGPHKRDATLETIEGNEAALFRVRTAKRKGLERIIALPTDYEPWALPVYDYFKKATDSVFPVTRQEVWKNARPYFEGWKCPIEYYKISGHQKVERHIRDFTLHSLRHLRATELRRFYHFRVDELAAYCGWTLRTVQSGMTSVMQRYQDLSMDYLDYFPRLLKARS